MTNTALTFEPSRPRPQDAPEDAPLAGVEHGHGHDDSGSWWLSALRLLVVALCAVAVWFEFPDVDPPVLVIADVLFIPFSAWAYFGLIFGGWPIFKDAIEDVLDRRMTMELSMSLAIWAAAYTGYFFPALFITFFVLVAEILEGMTVERGRRAIKELIELLPHAVAVRRDGLVQDVNAKDLAVGDIILVAPGALIPVDGTVISGHSFVDESRISGESAPAEKLAGSPARAGTVNHTGTLEIRAERIGADTSYGKIIEAVEQAERSRAPVQRLADKLAAYIIYMAIAFAILEYYFARSIIDAISVIIVAGACGVAAGTPLAILGGIGRSARLGAIIKGGVHLEMLGRVDTVVLDKTGTLTRGYAKVLSVIPAPGISTEELMAAAVTAESRSEHPFAKAIVRHAGPLAQEVLAIDHFSYTPGRGLLATAGGSSILVGSNAWMQDNAVAISTLSAEKSEDDVSRIFVARDGRFFGVIDLADEIRPEARSAVDRLKKLGLRVILLSGDSTEVVRAVAQSSNIDEYEACLLPEEKASRLRQMVSQKRIVAMVGDGVNDAPALATAAVGIAMGSGTDVARESADIVLLGNDLSRLVDTIEISRRTRRIIFFNFAGTILVDVAGVALIFMGFVGPLLAAIIHTGSELAFILNSARLLPGLPARNHTAARGTAPERAKAP